MMNERNRVENELVKQINLNQE